MLEGRVLMATIQFLGDGALLDDKLTVQNSPTPRQEAQIPITSLDAFGDEKDLSAISSNYPYADDSALARVGYNTGTTFVSPFYHSFTMLLNITQGVSGPHTPNDATPAVAPGSVPSGFIATVSANVKSLGNGLNEYDYTVSNSSQSTIPAYVFAISIDTGANLQSIASPAGWLADYAAGYTTITWSTGTAPLMPGKSLVFSFDSAESSSSSSSVTGFDPTTILFYPSTRTIPGPGTTPTPVPLVVTGAQLFSQTFLTGHGHHVKRTKKFAGFTLSFDEPLNFANVLNVGNYQVLQTVKHGRRSLAKAVSFHIDEASAESINVVLVGKPTFTRGGELILNTSGITDMSGGSLIGQAMFTILAHARGITG
jgi:hypothetical protein